MPPAAPAGRTSIGTSPRSRSSVRACRGESASSTPFSMRPSTVEASKR
jgi:hypothetical protein